MLIEFHSDSHDDDDDRERERRKREKLSESVWDLSLKILDPKYFQAYLFLSIISTRV
jgi:hypothetical protein